MKGLPTNLEDFISPARKNTTVAEAVHGEEQETVGYSVSKNPDSPCLIVPVDSDECFAKRIQTGNIIRYYVKFGLDGYMYDPWASMSDGSYNKMAKVLGRKVWEFKEVKKRGFEYYLTFLKSRNKAWKLNAEREVVNG